MTARAIAIVMGLAAVKPDPRAPDNDVLLDATLQAATGLAQLTKAPDAVSGLLELAKVSAAAGRTGTSD